MYLSTAKQPKVNPGSPQEAIDAMIAQLEPVALQQVTLSASIGCALGQQVVVDRPSPAADVSAMDGYAVCFDDITPDCTLPIAGEAFIGQQPPDHVQNKATRIVTGSPVPPGADTVIRREDVIEHVGRIEIPASNLQRLSSGANIRYRGENAAEGDVLASSGATITPALAGALASVGCSIVMVHRPVRVAILVTGDEVVGVEDGIATGSDARHRALSPYQLRDSNGPTLAAMFSQAPWIDVVAQHRVGDDRVKLRDAIEQLLSQSDALVITGGVSMGNRDFVPLVLEDVGARTIFHRVPQRPGMPMLGAIGSSGQAIFGLPGNPVSVMVTARRIAIGVLRHVAGFTQPLFPAHVKVENPDEKQLGLWWHRSVRMTGPGTAELVAGRGSGDVMAAAASDGFVEIPPGEYGAGPWPFYRWDIGL